MEQRPVRSQGAWGPPGRPDSAADQQDQEVQGGSLPKTFFIQGQDCPPEQAREMLALMTGEARDIVRCVFKLRKEYDRAG